MYYTTENENYRKYGIIVIEVYDKTLGTTVYYYRKPTPSERKEIILNYIIDNSGTPIKVNFLANKLAVSDRTIQKIIKELTVEGLIKVEPYFINNKQSGNKITYIGLPRTKTGKELTLDLLYDISNPYGFRDWDWEEFKLHPDLETHGGMVSSLSLGGLSSVGNNLGYSNSFNIFAGLNWSQLNVKDLVKDTFISLGEVGYRIAWGLTKNGRAFLDFHYSGYGINGYTALDNLPSTSAKIFKGIGIGLMALDVIEAGYYSY